MERTNNVSEAAHRLMGRELGMDHPSIFKFIEAIRSVQLNRDKINEQFVRGNNATNKRSVYRRADKNIRRIVMDGYNRLGGVTLLEYLRGLAHNYEL
jgi:hypothetical protein